MTVKLNAGSRLRSQVCLAEVVVVRSGTGDVQLTCGGVPMLPHDAQPVSTVSPASSLMGGAVLGKRYTAWQDDTFEVLVTKPGKGTLADGTEPLIIKTAKALPASD